jgi:hypothetical protein
MSSADRLISRRLEIGRSGDRKIVGPADDARRPGSYGRDVLDPKGDAR